jgi:catechol 2,3-dioxygenase
MAEAGFPVGWGLGRHVIGSNYFHYVRDPWGSWSEYTYDLDYVPKGMRWQAQDYPVEDAVYVWAPAMPEDFIVNHELIA